MPAALAMAMTPPTFHHVTVLSKEAVALLEPVLGPGRVAVDCTAGGGGHTAGLLATGAQVVAVDRDPTALEAVRARFSNEPRLVTVHGDFRDLESIVRDAAFGRVHAVLADLGVSSPQIDDPVRGFSFREGGPLDMRMDPSAGVPLAERLKTVDEPALTRVIKDLGEERRARQVARAILRARDEGELTDTARLAETVARAAGGNRRTHGGIHPATRTFQALRIWVNDELGALDALLEALPRVLTPGGRAALISFHSLEDRKVKRAFAELSKGCICPPDMPVCRCGRVAGFAQVTRRAIKAGEEETKENPRARSARLRVIEKEVDDG